MSGADSGTPQAAVGYFVDQKKGEVNELKQLLKNINVERDVKRKRETIKKVIAYMTLGIDVSRLFTDMIMAIETKDVVIKKMVYLYLCNYAAKEPEMAIMCINSLRRDCDNEDPMVRGLALRSLCSLRLDSILEYIELPLQKSLVDVSAYVRKTAVMAVLKVNQLSPDLVAQNGYVAKLYRMLDDPDASVITNCIFVLNELLLSQGGLAATQSLLMALLNRVGEFSEWGLNAVLDLVSRYKPATAEEVYAVMNLLDPLLRTANSGAVLSTVKCFIQLTKELLPELHNQIYTRAKPPLLTLITGAHSEGQYMILKHLLIMLHEPACQGVFDDEYRQFFVRYNEPSHVKHLKVDLLPLLTNESNARDIATELGEYVTDVDAELAKRGIRAIGRIAMKIEAVSVEMAQTMIDLINMDSPYVRAEAAKVLVDIIRINPIISGLVLPFVPSCIKRMEDTEAKASMVWLLGEFGEKIPESPYILETLIDGYSEEPSVTVKLQVLIASMKIFFKRPPEVQHMLGRLLKYAVVHESTTSQDLHDRALLYYRLLMTDPLNAESLFKSSCIAPSGEEKRGEGHFIESKDDEKLGQLLSEFNSLSIIYGMPSAQFIQDAYQLKMENLPSTDFDLVAAAPQSDDPQSFSGTPSVTPAPVGSVNLLDWDDDSSAAAIMPSTTANTRGPEQLRLTTNEAAAVNPAEFQSMWNTFPETYSGVACTLSSFPPTVVEVEAALKTAQVITIASGPVPTGFKLFLFGCAKDNSGADDFIMAEPSGTKFYIGQVSILRTGDGAEVQAIIKTNDAAKTKLFIDLLMSSLQSKFAL